MPTAEAAHFQVQGQDIIAVVVGPSFASKSEKDQDIAINERQMLARGAGLAGTVVAVWPGPAGTLRFSAPTPWHYFFEGLRFADIARNLNRNIRW